MVGAAAPRAHRPPVPDRPRVSRRSARRRYCALEASRRKAVGRGDHPAHRVHVVAGLRSMNCLQLRSALGDPGAVVQQGRDLAERREIDRQPARRPGAAAPGRKDRAYSVSPKNRGSRGTANLRFACNRSRLRSRPRVRILRVEPFMTSSTESALCAGVREHRHAVEGAAGRHHAARADQPARGLQPDQAVERRRHAAGARGVGAERESPRRSATATAEPELEPPLM